MTAILQPKQLANESTANGKQCLNCLPQPRGQVHVIAAIRQRTTDLEVKNNQIFDVFIGGKIPQNVYEDQTARVGTLLDEARASEPDGTTLPFRRRPGHKLRCFRMA